MEYLVQYGRSAFVGRFTHEGESPFARGQQVVVQSPRGVELGTLLGPARFASGVDAASGGRLIRGANAEDQTAAINSEKLSRQILTAAEEAPFPVTFLDCEVLHDARGAILHAVPYEACNLDPLLAELSDRFDLAVRLMNIAAMPTMQDPPEPKSSCSSGNCGSGGGCSTGGCGTKSEGGCSTGSCSSGKVKSAEELTNYFADLRTKMETRVPLV
jgi:hypothetical protein